jgi:hypothetical protein
MKKGLKTLAIELYKFKQYADGMRYWANKDGDVIVDRETYMQALGMCRAEMVEARDDATHKHRRIRAAFAAAEIAAELYGYAPESDAYRAKRIAWEHAIAAKVGARRVANPNESSPIEFLS